MQIFWQTDWDCSSTKNTENKDWRDVSLRIKLNTSNHFFQHSMRKYTMNWQRYDLRLSETSTIERIL